LIEECRNDAKAYVELLQARTVDDDAAFVSETEADVATIRADSEEQAHRIRVEAKERIARRMQVLQQELADHAAAIERETVAVQERAAAFQDELTRFFEKVLQGAEPPDFASMASQMPTPPVFDPEVAATLAELERLDLGPEATSQPETMPEGEPPVPTGAEVEPAPARVASTRAPLLPGNLSGAGAVRGRLFSEWYPEVERLRDASELDLAVALLLEIVTATEAESQAEGSSVASRPYAELADIYEGRNDFANERSILERFSRREHASNAASAALLERLKVLKKPKR
jgi:hypothetical protein